MNDAPGFGALQTPADTQEWTAGRLRCLNDGQLLLGHPKFAKKITPTSLHHQQLPQPRLESGMHPCFCVV